MNVGSIRRAVRQPLWPDRRTQIPQVRIEVNFKCGKACFYCRPSGEGLSIQELEQAAGEPVHMMTVAEFVEVVEVLARHGVTDLKLTGGDPMLRADIVELVYRLKAVPGIASVGLVTRHYRVGELAGALKEVGLSQLTISLDSLDATTWTRITRVKGHARLVEAVRTAARTGISLRINTVVLRGVNDHEIPALVGFAGEIGAKLKLLDLITDIGVFPGFGGHFAEDYYADLVPVAEWLSTWANSTEVITQPGGLGHPMLRFRMPNGATVTIKSSRFGAYYGSVCADCPLFPCRDALMALRVTPNRMLQYCLLRNDNLIDLLGLLHGPSPAEADTVVAHVLGVYRTATPWTGEAIAQVRTAAKSAIPSFGPISVSSPTVATFGRSLL